MKITPIMFRTTYCPKCHYKTLRLSVNSYLIYGYEMFCDHCHQYSAYLDVMDFDVADQYEIDNSHEPHWSSAGEREEAYQVVTNMFLGIEEWMIEEDYSVDTGALHV